MIMMMIMIVMMIDNEDGGDDNDSDDYTVGLVPRDRTFCVPLSLERWKGSRN